MEQFELNRGELAECALPAASVGGPLDHATIAKRSSARVDQSFQSSMLRFRSAKNDSMAALSAHAPTRPIGLCNPLCDSAWTNFRDLNWLPLSRWCSRGILGWPARAGC